MKKKRGRPKGSKNKIRINTIPESVIRNVDNCSDWRSVMTQQNKNKEYNTGYEFGYTTGYRAALRDIIKDTMGGF